MSAISRSHFIVFITVLFAIGCLAWYIDKDKSVSARYGMVVSEQHLASKVGIRILQEGGNAVDAAVAVGYALAVVNPCCGNLGGGGFMTLHLANGQNTFLNFRERAPLNANAQMFSSAQAQQGSSTRGYRAVAVPGTVLGFETARLKYGTLSRQRVMAPAIELASQGYLLTAGDVALLQRDSERFIDEPNIARVFLHNNKPYRVGEKLIQTDLAKTLTLIAEQGYDAFYKGPIAATIVRESNKHNGLLQRKDFEEYFVEELHPIMCTYRDYQIISAPPPSSGGVALCEMLNILENVPLASWGRTNPQSIYYTIAAMRNAFYDRNHLLGDPDFILNPIEKLTAKKYAWAIFQKIKNSMQAPLDNVVGTTVSHEGVNTTHYSIVDKWGNAVSVTFTLNSFYGAHVMAGDTGFFLNNEMDDFATTALPNKFGLVQSEQNSIQPGKRPLSSMTPTIVLKNGHIAIVIGSPGGPRIITATLLALLNKIDYGMTIKAAVDAPRYHNQWLPNTVYSEPGAFSQQVEQALQQQNIKIQTTTPWAVVEAINIDPITQTIYGANDKRRPAGLACGY